MRWPTKDDLIDIALVLLILAICAPGVLWWIGTFVAVFTGERPW